MARKGDSETQLEYSHVRTNRMLEEDGSWFFRTREGTMEGPYMDEWEAQTWVDLYVSFMASDLPFIEDGFSLNPTKLDKTA